MSHADELMNLADVYGAWCERYGANETHTNMDERQSARAALREACEKLCGALDGLIDASSPFGPIDDGSVVWSKTRTELGFAINSARAAIAHLTKGTS